MCNVEPDEISEMVKITESLRVNCNNSKCRKCGSEEVEVVLRLKEPYCRICYLSYFVHKFRSTIGKSKQIQAGDEVLVAVSTGVSSAAIVHLIQQGTSEESAKRLRFKPTFLHIDETKLRQTKSDSGNTIHTICNHIIKCGFKCYVVPIECVMSKTEIIPKIYNEVEYNPVEECTTNHLESLNELISGCGSKSSQQDILYRLRQQLICKTAIELGFQKVFVADNATTIAVRILTDMAQGRGSQLSSDVHFKAIYNDVELYRPLRENLEDEVHHYARIFELPYSVSSFNQFEESNKSIKACTKKFILDLQKDFPATIPTVFRTGDKLVSSCVDDNNGSDEIHENCILCGNAKDTSQKENSALFATIISERYSSESKLEPDQDLAETNGICLEEKDSCSGSCSCTMENSMVMSISALNKSLCYSCRIIIRELKSTDLLPEAVKIAASENIRRSKMKEEIQAYLL